MDYNIPYKHYEILFSTINNMPNDSDYLKKILNSLKTDSQYINTEICLLQDKINSKGSKLSTQNESRLRKFIEQIKKISPIAVYLVKDESYNWYSDMNKDGEIAITLHSECGKDGVIQFKAEIVTEFMHATEICLEMLGPASEVGIDMSYWKLFLEKSLAKKLDATSNP